MKSNKCPKCGFITLAAAAVCKSCSYQFSEADTNSANSPVVNSSKKPNGFLSTFCGLNLLLVSIVCGVILCLGWNSYVLSYILPSGRYPLILLVVFYLPPGILALVVGFVWYVIIKIIFETMGFKISEIE